MNTQKKASLMIAIFSFFFFIALPGTIADAFNVRDPELDITSCDNSDTDPIASTDWELEDSDPDNVYPVVELEVGNGGKWLGRGEDSGDFEITDTKLEGAAHDFDVIIEVQHVGSGRDDYCEADFEAELELKDPDFRASSEPRDFNIILKSEQWDGSRTTLEVTEEETITKDYRSKFKEDNGEWIELPNLGGYEPDWGLPYDCDDECIQDELEDEEELLQYGWSEREIWNLYWPPYEPNTYNVLPLSEQCEDIAEEVEDYVEGGDTDSDLRTSCPYTRDVEDEYVYEGDNMEVHRYLRDLNNIEEFPYPRWRAEVDKHSLHIDVEGAGSTEPGETVGDPHTFKGGDGLRDPDNVTVRAIPTEGYGFDDWNGCDHVENHLCHVEMDDDKEVEAFFEEETVNIEIIDPESNEEYREGDDLTVEWEARNNYEDTRELEEVTVELTDRMNTVENEINIGEDVDNTYTDDITFDSSELDDFVPQEWNDLQIEIIAQWEDLEFSSDSVILDFKRQDDVEECIEKYEEVIEEIDLENCTEVGYVTCGDDYEIPVYCEEREDLGEELDDLEIDYDYQELGMPEGFHGMVFESWDELVSELLIMRVAMILAEIVIDELIEYFDELTDGTLTDIADDMPDFLLELAREEVNERVAEIIAEAIERILHDQPEEPDM